MKKEEVSMFRVTFPDGDSCAIRPSHPAQIEDLKEADSLS